MNTMDYRRKLLFMTMLLSGALFITSCANRASDGTTSTGSTIDASLYGDDELVDLVIYPHDQVVDVHLVMDSSEYQDMLDHAMDEVYHTCDITYNGYALTNVAIRTKGNSSLRDVFESGGDRFSFNVDLNYYVDQDLFGIDKLILNNLYMDPSMMAEYVAYEALASLDATASRTTFVALSINGEYYGLYLSVEDVGNEFLENRFGDSDGEFYKPEIGIGADLQYLGDQTDYRALIDLNADESANDNSAIVEFMSRISSGSDLSEVFDVDGYLKYLAVSTYTVNLDSYQGSLYHNYYLYNDDGVFEWIPWDLNMTFNGFPGANLSDAKAINYLIDEPTVNQMSDFPLIEAVMSNAGCLSTYHQYLRTLIDGYFEDSAFAERVRQIADMIDPYVQADANSFYFYQEFRDALFGSSIRNYSILDFVEARNANVNAQLSGAIPSTNGGLGNGITVRMPR